MKSIIFIAMGLAFIFLPRIVHYIGTFGVYIRKTDVSVKGLKISTNILVLYRVVGTMNLLIGIILALGYLL